MRLQGILLTLDYLRRRILPYLKGKKKKRESEETNEMGQQIERGIH